jgi:peroxiredoxin
MLQIGQKAPDFKLVDTEKNEVTLEQFRGKNVVLFFFPMAWTGVCTKEMCAIQEDYAAYQSLNAQTIGVSVDSLFALKRFGEDNKINFPMLSDLNKQAINDYDVVHQDFAFGYKNVAKRATFVIDKEGVLRFAEVLPQLGDMPNMDAIKEALKGLN